MILEYGVAIMSYITLIPYCRQTSHYDFLIFAGIIPCILSFSKHKKSSHIKTFFFLALKGACRVKCC